jgi:hypothetical protein
MVFRANNEGRKEGRNPNPILLEVWFIGKEGFLLVLQTLKYIEMADYSHHTVLFDVVEGRNYITHVTKCLRCRKNGGGGERGKKDCWIDSSMMHLKNGLIFGFSTLAWASFWTNKTHVFLCVTVSDFFLVLTTSSALRENVKPEDYAKAKYVTQNFRKSFKVLISLQLVLARPFQLNWHFGVYVVISLSKNKNPNKRIIII